MLRKLVVGAIFVLVLLCAAGGFALWFFLSSWVPVSGKTLLIKELERRAPVSAAIGTMHYEWPRDMILQQVRVVSRETGEVWFDADTVSIRVGWFSLAVRKQFPFHAESSMTVPCRTAAELNGRLNLRTSEMRATLQTQAFAADDLASFLRKRLPPQLRGGTFRLQIEARQPASGALAIESWLKANRVIWDIPPGQLTADAEIKLLAKPPHPPQNRWIIEAEAGLMHGSLEHMPIIGKATDIEAAVRYTDGEITLKQLKAAALESVWQAEGAADASHYELLLASRAQTGALLATVPELAKQWSVKGAADVRAVCRGSFQNSKLMDCLIAAGLRQLTIGGAKLPEPLEQVNGRLFFDALARQLTIEQLNARLMNQPLRASGRVNTAAKPPQLLLSVEGVLPLKAANPWLSSDGPVAALDGTAEVDVTVAGQPPRLSWLGQLTLKDAKAATKLGEFTEVSGAAVLDEEKVALHQWEAVLDGHPLNFEAEVSPSPLSAAAAPAGVFRITAAIEVPEGSSQMRLRAGPEAVWVDEAVLLLEKSRLRLAGTIARNPARASQLSAAGVIELDELGNLPVKMLQPLKTWQAQGLADVEASFEGLLGDAAGADITARLSATSLRVHQVPLNDVRLFIEQRRRLLKASIPSATVAGGSLIAELSLKQDATRSYQAKADLSGLQLEQLKQTIPAWRTRSVAGTASAHAELSGLLNQRPSWAGDGWINVNGTQLGDVPLLDNLFRGLFGILGERMGLESLRRAQVTQASVSWQLKQERLRTEDLRLGGFAGTEPVAIYVKGSAGLDGTLDFVIEPEFSEAIMLQAPSTSTLSSAILKAAGQLDRARRLIGRHRLTGTVKKPDYRFELSVQEAVKQLAPRPGDLIQGLQGILDAVRQQQ